MSAILQSSFLALVALGIILACCELFTNAVEWLGVKLKLPSGVVGSVLAAVGTALPETIVPIVALLFVHGGQSQEIGIGSIIGAPFMLSTLAFVMTGLAAIIYHARGKRGLNLVVDVETLGQDMVFFLGVYALAIGAAFVPVRAIKIAVAIVLLGCYWYYVRRHLQREAEAHHANLPPLHLSRQMLTPRLRMVLLQIVVSLAAMFLAAELFVRNLQVIATALGSSLLGWSPSTIALVLSLTITPIATELPEKFNSIIWVSRRKDTLALGNVTGAMVFQSCFPVTVGILLTPWELAPRALAAAIVALLSVSIVYLWMRKAQKLSPYLLVGVGASLYIAWLWYALRM